MTPMVAAAPTTPPRTPPPAGGSVYGATDELGYHAVENVCTIYDLWATVMYLLGIDHERLTYRYAGRDVRLTDVHGNVLSGVIA